MLRRRGWAAVLTGCLIVVTLLGFEVLRLWALAPAGQRAFIQTNADCLRCHGDMAARLDDVSVHEPFVNDDCLVCHTPHEPKELSVTTLGRLSSAGLIGFVDRVLIAVITRVVPMHMRPPVLRAEASSAKETSAAADASATISSSKPGAMTTSGLQQPADRLCWTCHGDMGPMLGESAVHAPFAAGACTSCHDPHTSKVRTLLTAEPETLCSSCHRVGPELLATVVHEPFGRRDCLACHDAHASDVGGMLVANQRELCVGCHASIQSALLAADQHEPVATGDCTGCHRPHSADRTQLLVDAAPGLCYRCHPGVGEQFALSTTHPVECRRCHDPHASAYARLLPSEQRTMCLGCHSDVQAELAREYLHKPAAQGDCTQCHTPHGSAYTSLMAGSLTEVCTGCHPDRGSTPPANDLKVASAKNQKAGAIRAAQWKAASISISGVEDPWAGRPTGVDIITHPYEGARPSGLYSHPTSETAAGFQCDACHEPHGADFDGIFIKSPDALCRDCHGTDVAQFATSSHRDVACTTCHDLHESPDPKLLKEAAPGVCVRCHDSATYTQHPVGGAYWDYNANTTMTCTSTCHDPHGSQYYVMLRVPYGTEGKGSDYLCLICHTEVGITY